MKNSEIWFSKGIAIVKNFNEIDIDSLQHLKDIKMPIRALLDNIPNQEKISILNNEVLTDNASMFTLVLSSKNTNWINLLDFQCLTHIQNIEIHNTTLGFNSIEGVQNFRNLKSFKLLHFYEKEMDLKPFSLCENLETLVLDIALTKSHHEDISNLKKLKTLKVRKLKTAYITRELSNIEFLEVYNLQDTFLNCKMPNLKNLRVYNSNSLENVNFLSSLNNLEWIFLYGLNKVVNLPDFTNLSVLKQVTIQNMKGLKDISSLETAKQLTTLCLRNNMTDLSMLSWLKPENFPFLKNLIVELKCKKETEMFYERFKNVKLEN